MTRGQGKELLPPAWRAYQ